MNKKKNGAHLPVKDKMMPVRKYGHWKTKKREVENIQIQCDDSLYKNCNCSFLNRDNVKEIFVQKISVTLNSLLEREGCVSFLTEGVNIRKQATKTLEINSVFFFLI